EFTLEDFRDQLRQVKKMGPLESLLEMLPGAGGRARALAGSVDEKSLRRVEAMIDSMTVEERRHPHVIDGSRRRRIARGSGATIQDVNRLLRQFEEARKLFRRVGEMQKGKRGKIQFPLQ
ncbi:MAG: signal recognition particle protein, partial [bacterium]